MPDVSPSPLSRDKPDPALGSEELTPLSARDAMQMNRSLGFL